MDKTHLLSKLVEYDDDQWAALRAVYDSLYQKIEDAYEKSITETGKYRTVNFSDIDTGFLPFLNSLTLHERDVLCFHMMAHPSADSILEEYLRPFNVLRNTRVYEHIDMPERLRDFDIPDGDMFGVLSGTKLNSCFFLYRMKVGRGFPMFHHTGESYLSPHDELELWRSATDLMKRQYASHLANYDGS